MELVGQKFFGLVIALVVIVAIIISFYMKDFSHYDKSSLHTFISIVTGLGILVLFTFYFANIESITQGDDIEYKKEISQINELVYIKIPEKISLLRSHHLSQDKKCAETFRHDIFCDENKCVECNNLSYMVFSAWKRFLLFAKYIEKEGGIEGHLHLFCEWSGSKCIHSYWKEHRQKFDSHTIKFGDAVFQHGAKDLPTLKKIALMLP